MNRAVLPLLLMILPVSVSAWEFCGDPCDPGWWRSAEVEAISETLAASDPKFRNAENETILHYAAALGNRENVVSLLRAGADPNATDINGSTPLHRTVVGFGDVGERIMALVAAGADVNATTKDGGTPLHGAAFVASVEAADALIASGADVNARDDSGMSALHRAFVTFDGGASSGDFINLLLAAGCDIDAQAAGGWNALQFAAQNDLAAIVEQLLNAGPNANLPNDAGQTALDIAIENQTLTGTTAFEMLAAAAGG